MTAEYDDRDNQLASIEAAAIALAYHFDEYVAGDVGTSLTCSEVDALTTLFRLVGKPELADAWIEFHAEGDEPDDSHYRGDSQ